MSMRFNPPPNWPVPPAGWTPPPGWRPDPSWGPAPPGWQLWVTGPTAFAAPAYPAPPLTAGTAGTPWTATQQSRSRGTAMVAVAAGSCGLAGFVPPLWAARQRPHDAAFRRRMYAVAGGLLALTVTAMTVASIAEEDATGVGVGLSGDLSGMLMFLNLVLAITVAVLVRKADVGAELPGVAEELARRRLREQYRQLATGDPALGRSMRIGRPDLPRHLDDGGLVDLNAIPEDRLGPLAGLSAEEAGRVADARRQLGRFTSLEEVAVYADLPETTMTSLRERAIVF